VDADEPMGCERICHREIDSGSRSGTPIPSQQHAFTLSLNGDQVAQPSAAAERVRLGFTAAPRWATNVVSIETREADKPMRGRILEWLLR
jgi:hypothetical protein